MRDFDYYRYVVHVAPCLLPCAAPHVLVSSMTNALQHSETYQRTRTIPPTSLWGLIREFGIKGEAYSTYYKQKQARNRRQSTHRRRSRCANRGPALGFPEMPLNSEAIKIQKVFLIKKSKQKKGHLKPSVLRKASKLPCAMFCTKHKHSPRGVHSAVMELSARRVRRAPRATRVAPHAERAPRRRCAA